MPPYFDMGLRKLAKWVEKLGPTDEPVLDRQGAYLKARGA